MKSQIEHININIFHLISEMFTIYLPFHIERGEVYGRERLEVLRGERWGREEGLYY
jgi:hypothetical protein